MDENKKGVTVALEMQRAFIGKEYERGAISGEWYNGYLTALKFAENAMGEAESSAQE